MVPQTWIGQRQHRGRKEHGLIIRVRNQQTDALVPELGEARARDGDGVQPAGDGDEGQGQERQPLELHGCWLLALAVGDAVFRREESRQGECRVLDKRQIGEATLRFGVLGEKARFF